MAKSEVKQEGQTFEAALGRLEEIVGEMEGDRLTLEEILVRYEEGTRLVKVCQQRLDAAEKRIDVITKGTGGEVQIAAFETVTAAAAAAPVAEVAVKRRGGSAVGQGSNPEEVSLF